MGLGRTSWRRVRPGVIRARAAQTLPRPWRAETRDLVGGGEAGGGRANAGTGAAGSAGAEGEGGAESTKEEGEGGGEGAEGGGVGARGPARWRRATRVLAGVWPASSVLTRRPREFLVVRGVGGALGAMVSASGGDGKGSSAEGEKVRDAQKENALRQRREKIEKTFRNSTMEAEERTLGLRIPVVRRKESLQVLAANAQFMVGSLGRRAGHLCSNQLESEASRRKERTSCLPFWLVCGCGCCCASRLLREGDDGWDERVGLENFDSRREGAMHYATTYHVSGRIFGAANKKNLALPIVVNYREKKLMVFLRLCATGNVVTWEAPT